MLKLKTMLIGFATAAAIGVPAMAGGGLKDAYQDTFVIGAALNVGEIIGTNKLVDPILAKHFNSISPENDLKWERVHPAPNSYDFAVPDAYVALGEKNHFYTVGHVLLWHNQTPKWVFEDKDGKPASRDVLLARLKDHIATVVGRYKGKIKSWDVVNEVIGDDGAMRSSPWYKIIGDDYIAKAFEYAHAADPQAELTYNDFNIEYPAKRAGALALVKKLKAAGVPINTVGIQGHYLLNEPDLKLLDETIAAFGALGVKVAITELDIDVLPRPSGGATADITLKLAADPKANPYGNGLPDDVQQKLAARYAEIFAICRKHKGVVNRVTLWGVTDADSWHNDWPIPGRTAYSLLFDRAGNAKPAVDAIIKAAAP